MVANPEVIPARKSCAKTKCVIRQESDFRAQRQPLERESDHRTLIDVDSPASSKAAAPLL